MKNKVLAAILNGNGDEDIDIFALIYETGISYDELKPLLAECIEEESITSVDGRNFRFIGDRDAVSATLQMEPNRDDDETTSAEKYDEESKQFDERRAYLEARRQELIRRLQAQMAEDEDDEEEIEDEESRETDYVDCSPMLRAIVRKLESVAKVYRDQVRICFIPFELNVFGGEMDFELLSDGDENYISDQGTTLKRLYQRVPLSTEGIREEIDKIVQEYGIEIVESQLKIEILDPDEAVACLMYLYSAMERINSINENFVSAFRKQEKSNMACREFMSQLVREEGEITREQALMRTKKKFFEVQESEGYESLSVYVRALRVLAALNDEDFDLFRKQALGA